MYTVIAINTSADMQFSWSGTLVECAKKAKRLHNRMGAIVKILRPDGSNIANRIKVANIK